MTVPEQSPVDIRTLGQAYDAHVLMTDLLADVPPESSFSDSSLPFVVAAVAVIAAVLIAVGVVRRRSSGKSASADTDR